MALRWKLDQPLYGPDGLVTLYRGDDFLLTGKLINLIRGYEEPVDSTVYSVSGFFPSASGGPDLLGLSSTGDDGMLVVGLPSSLSPYVQLNSGGEGPYVVLQDVHGKLITVPTTDQAVAILDRSFTT